jgi:hypothetical protein
VERESLLAQQRRIGSRAAHARHFPAGTAGRLPDRLLPLLAIAISGSVGVVARGRRGPWTECRIVALLARSWRRSV